MMKRNIIIATAILITSLFSGCFTDDIVIDPDNLTEITRPIPFAGPILKSDVSANDLLEKLKDSITDFIQVEPDGLLCVKYKDSISAVWDDIITIENVNFQKSYSVTNMTKLNFIEYSYVERIKLNTDPSQRFDSMFIEDAILSLELTFPDGCIGDVYVEFPELTKNDEALIFSYDVSLKQVSDSEDLTGYQIHFGQGIDSSYFTMNVVANVSFETAPTPGQNPEVDLSLTMIDLIPEILFGRFGQLRIMDKTESMSFDFFEDLETVNYIEFFDIQTNTIFDNYFGIPYNGTLQNAVLRNSSSGESINLVFNDSNTIFVEAAKYSESIIPTSNSVPFNKDNSNINDVLNAYPDKLDYHLTVDINPRDKNGYNFITQENKIAGNMHVKIPLWLRTSEYKRTDTIPGFDANQLFSDEIIEYLKTATLTFDFINWFPFELTTQVYVINENYIIIDTLLADNHQLLESGKIDADGKVLEAGFANTNVVLTKEKIELYKSQNVKDIILSTRTITADNGAIFVKIFDYHGFEFRLSLELETDEIKL